MDSGTIRMNNATKYTDIIDKYRRNGEAMAKNFKGISRQQRDIYIQYQDCNFMFGRLLAFILCLRRRYGNAELKSLGAMIHSLMSQRKYMKFEQWCLRSITIPPEDLKAFQWKTKQYDERINHCLKIIGENIVAYDAYPYWKHLQDTGKLKEVLSETICDRNDSYVEVLQVEFNNAIETYNTEHPEEVERLMKEGAEQQAVHNAYVAEIKQKKQAEKEARTATRKAENAEVREIKANAKRHRAEERKTQKYYERLLPPMNY